MLKRGAGGSFEDVLIAGLFTIFDGSVYHGWYGGYDGDNTNIIYVLSAEGINCAKHSGPVITHGSGGSWDEFVVYQPAVIYDGEMYHVWFGGHNGFKN